MSDGASLDTSGGIYQVGMTMSKFVFGKNLTELEGFRDGFFEFHMKEIGLYKDSNDKAAQLAPVVPNVLTKQEAQKQRPLVLKVLLPIAKLFFSEQR